ncbi:MAG TPA: sigma-70 family RNA polymerase sigma factor [Candidatus Nanopelagicales bacterium]|nr:sigma-70 family RNA polymerase sigma factor [Candidatus Nanopelagicales bacterium]
MAGSPKNKKADAFTAALAEHRRTLVAHLIRKGLSVDDANDVVQEVLSAAFNASSRFNEQRGPLLPWLFGITAYKLRKLRHALWRRFEHPWTAEEVERIADDTPPSDVQLIAERRRRVLDDLLAEIPEDRRRLIELHDLLGLDMPTIANMLGLNINTAWYHHRVAVEELRAAARRWKARHNDRPAIVAALLALEHDGPAPAPAPAPHAAPALRQGFARLAGPALGMGIALVVPLAVSARNEGPAIPQALVTSIPLPAPPSPASPEPAPAPPIPDPPAAAIPFDQLRGRGAGKHAEADQIRAEQKLVERARNAMRARQFQEAHRLLVAHERQFRRGKLARERNELLEELLSRRDTRPGTVR